MKRVPEKTAQRFNYITVLSVVSAISVIILHTNGCFWTFSRERYWISANIIESVFYFAVPIFFMITGATLLDYNLKYGEKEYAKKRIAKTFIPFLIWSIFGLMYRLFITKTIKLDDLSFQYVINGILNTNIISIFWFFKNLFMVYLILPILANVKQEKKIRLYSYLIVAFLILNVLIPFMSSMFKLGIKIPIIINAGCESMVYVLIGYVLSKKELKRSTRIVIYVLGIVGLLVHILLTQMLSFDAGKIITTFKGYQNLPCIAYSVAVFIFVKQISNKMRFKKVFQFLSQYTFAFYLMQYFIYTTVQLLTKWNTRSLIYRLGMPFIVIAVTIAITWILRKIPVVRKIVP